MSVVSSVCRGEGDEGNPEVSSTKIAPNWLQMATECVGSQGAQRQLDLARATADDGANRRYSNIPVKENLRVREHEDPTQEHARCVLSSSTSRLSKPHLPLTRRPIFFFLRGKRMFHARRIKINLFQFAV